MTDDYARFSHAAAFGVGFGVVLILFSFPFWPTVVAGVVLEQAIWHVGRWIDR